MYNLSMNFPKLKYILFATFIAMILHTIEEYITRLWSVDTFIVGISNYFEISGVVVYLLIQFFAFLLILILLIQTFQRKINKILLTVLALVFLFELLHIYESFRIWGYYSGLYTGIILLIIGYFYWKELIHNLRLGSAK